jgi:exonuclease SbcC
MRIAAIRLQNFRNFEDRTVSLGDRTFLAGLNGAGKSTVIDAISWALRGVCRGTDARGAGSKDLIRTDQDAASVSITLDGLGTITRTVARNGGGGCTMKTDAILARLDTTDAAVEAVLYGGAFFGLHHGDAKNLLLKVLDIRIPADALPGANLTEPADLDTLDLLYKAAFENRAAAKKVLAAVAVPDLPKVVNLEHDPDLLAAQATKARTAERDATGIVGGLTAELLGVTVARQKLQPVNVDELAGQRTVHEGLLREEVQKAADAAARLADLEGEAGLSAGEIGAKIGERRTLVAKIEGHDPDRGCVLNPAVPCLTEVGKFVKAITDLKKQIKALETDSKKAEARSRETAQAQSVKTAADRAVTYHQTQVGKIDDALAAADEVDEQISRLDAERVRLDAALERAKKDQAARIAESGELAAAAVAAAAYREAIQARQTAEGRRNRYQAEVDRLEALVTVLGPNGVRATALQKSLKDFEGAINAALDGFRFSLAFTVDPWKVEISRDGGETCQRFDLLSDGEKLWTGVCFQQALAAVTGLDFVAVDATEKVVGLKRGMLTRLIMLSPVEQVLVAMAKGEGEGLPEIDGLTVINLSENAGADDGNG